MGKNTKTQKSLKGKPKLKTILADPYKRKCSVLPNGELKELHDLLAVAIAESGQSPRAFATSKGIRLGMASSLRAINNKQTSCVFISLSIRPPFLVSLIGRNSEQIDGTAPVYAQAKLEDFTKELFGVGAMLMVFPPDIKAISLRLADWVNKRRKLPKLPNTPVAIPTQNKPKTKRKVETPIQEVKIRKTSPKEEMSATTPMEIDSRPALSTKSATKAWDGDFIPLSETGETIKLDQLRLHEDKEQLIQGLNAMTQLLTKQNAKPAEAIGITDTKDSDTGKALQQPVESDSDEFLGDYHHLSVHKIQPNPNKKPKKKRNKKNKNTK